MANVTQDQVIEYLSNLSVMDIAKLTKSLEDKWGVKAAPVAVAGPAAGGGGEAAPKAAAPRDHLSLSRVYSVGLLIPSSRAAMVFSPRLATSARAKAFSRAGIKGTRAE